MGLQSMSYLPKVINISLLLFLVLQQTRTQQINSGINITINVPDSTNYLVTNGTPNGTFIEDIRTFDCSLTPLYTYSQSSESLTINAPYTLAFTGITNPTVINLSTVHKNFIPTYSPTVCQPPGCTVTIYNNCPSDINFFNYFDRVVLNIENYPTELTYYVKCNQEFLTNTFEWGLIIQIVVITILMAIVALYSRAWSLGGQGININLGLIMVFNAALILGGIIGYLSDDVITIILYVITFVAGIIGVGICANELLFLLRLKPLMFTFFKLKTFEFRMLQVVSLMIGTGVVIGWFYSQKNMILNDVICLCMIVAFIKILKFTSLKIAGLSFLITIAIELIIAFLIYFLANQSYNSLFLNRYNFPFELQIPTINPVYNQKCAWLPFTSVVYPGILFSYLRRFDASRSTRLYLIIGTATFFIGAIAWMFISIASPVDFPFGLVSEPCMFGLICMFAYRRRQIRTLWDGKFYDEQFGDREDLQVALEMIGMQSRISGKTIDSRIIDELKQGNPRDSFRSTQSNVIRTKFLKAIEEDH